ncbi:hypothetical protein BGZ46_004960, partial [Entomortierella lignicola]
MSDVPTEKNTYTPVVLIIGGGIGGLMLGAILETANINYHIFERSTEIRPLGSSIGISSNILPVFEQLGIFEDLKKVSIPQLDMEFYDMKGNRTGRVETKVHKIMYVDIHGGYEYYLLSRPKLYDVLRSRVPAHKISMGKKVLRTKEENDGITVYCSDNTAYECTILVGADGAYSAVRQNMYRQLDEKGMLPESDKDDFTIGFVNILGVASPLNPEKYNMSCDDRAHFRVLIGDKNESSYAASIRDNQVCWGIQIQLSSSDAKTQHFRNSEWGPESIDAMIKEFEDFPCPFGGTMKDLFDTTPKHLISKVFLEEKLFKTWYHGRSVLIGDACHKVNPGALQGAVLAMKDAVVLANCIFNMKDDSSKSIKSAFESYYKQCYPEGEIQVQNGTHMTRVMLGQ